MEKELRQQLEDLREKYEAGELSITEYLEKSNSLDPYCSNSISLIGGLKMDFGLGYDKRTEKLRFYAKEDDESAPPHEIRSWIQGIKEELAEEDDEDVIISLNKELARYKFQLNWAEKRYDREFVTKEQAQYLADFFTKLANEL